MELIERIKNKAREDLKTLILPESMDERVLRAAERIVREGFTKGIILLGKEEEIYKEARKYKVSLERVKVIDPVEESKKKDEYAQIYYELRKHKNISLESAMEAVKDPIYFASIMVRTGEADTLVAGSVHTTSNILRAALRVIDRTSRTGIVSSCFIMLLPNPDIGEEGILAFADAGVVPNPDTRELADIAISTAQTFKLLTGCEPRVAMLSFSTKGSAQHRMIDKVIEATRIVKENNPEILIDGELQSDAALVPSVAKKKAPASPVAGKANVLIFPDLNSANIAYKLVERLAAAKAYGPLVQGLSKPISDLSRGCSVDDIVDISAIALVRAQGV